MKKQLLVIATTSLLTAIILSGCTNNNTSSGADSRFVGEWEQDILGSNFLWKFNDDSTLWMGPSGGAMYNTGKWNVEDNKLFLYNNTISYTYELSNNGNKLTFNVLGDSFGHPTNFVLIKKGTRTYLSWTRDSETNRLTVVTIDSIDIYKWKDIEVGFKDKPVTYQIFNKNGTPIDAINQTSGAGDSEVAVGDYILFSNYTGNNTVTLRFGSTLLGTWTINV